MIQIQKIISIMIGILIILIMIFLYIITVKKMKKNSNIFFTNKGHLKIGIKFILKIYLILKYFFRFFFKMEASQFFFEIG